MTAYTLNLFDLACTMYALENGVEELNPIMRNIPFQIFYKVVVIGLLCYWLESQKARKALRICTAVYAVVDVWHIVNIAPSLWAVLFY